MTRVIFYLSFDSRITRTIPALLRLLHNSSEVERTVLPYLFSISRRFPVSPLCGMTCIFGAETHHQTVLSPYYSQFFIRSHDLRVTKLEKLRILRSTLTADNHQVLLKEFIVRVSSLARPIFDSRNQHYAEDPDDNLVERSIRAIGYCARVVPECTQQALNAMMTFIQSKHGWLSLFESVSNRTLNRTRQVYSLRIPFWF